MFVNVSHGLNLPPVTSDRYLLGGQVGRALPRAQTSGGRYVNSAIQGTLRLPGGSMPTCTPLRGLARRRDSGPLLGFTYAAQPDVMMR